MNKELLIAYGFGDGGGGVNRDMLENRRRIDKIPGLPNLKTSTAAEYFRDLQETVKIQTSMCIHGMENCIWSIIEEPIQVRHIISV